MTFLFRDGYGGEQRGQSSGDRNEDAEKWRPSPFELTRVVRWFNPSRRPIHANDVSAARFDAVVEQEAPVHENIVVVRIARAHGLQRAGHIVEQTILRTVTAAARAGAIARRDTFLWPTNVRAATPPRPARGQSLRAIEHVAPEEISEAAMLVIRSSRGINDSDLTREAARVLGYQRTGEKIEQIVTRVINDFVAASRIVIRTEFMVVPGDGSSYAEGR